jgi:RNase P subunit RPR2
VTIGELPSIVVVTIGAPRAPDKGCVDCGAPLFFGDPISVTPAFPDEINKTFPRCADCGRRHRVASSSSFASNDHGRSCRLRTLEGAKR